MGHYVPVCPTLPSRVTDCPGAQWSPDPSLGGDPPGHHPLTHPLPRCCQEWRQTCRGITETVWVALVTRTVHKLNKPGILSFPFVIVSPALSGLIILVSTHSTSCTMYIRKDFSHLFLWSSHFLWRLLSKFVVKPLKLLIVVVMNSAFGLCL